ncbi:MAG: TonB-dependent receptor plug domain-containing protein [Bacteroidales bacterium]|nr:TonB-dependent receptor plug domain-containing protein [Bacteroidales bacterium]
MKKTICIAALMAVFGLTNLNAQTSGKPFLITDTVKIEEVVITGTKTPTSINKLPQKVEIITKDKIQNSTEGNLSNFLKSISGIDIIEYPGLLSGIGIRGFRPEYNGINKKILTLIDGRPAAATNLSMLDIRNVERIEILRGPASALYGPQAMGGVVNIITKQSQDKIQGNASIAYGSFDQSDFNLAVGGKISKKFNFDIGVNRKQRATDYKLGNGNVFRSMLGGEEVNNWYKNNDSTSVDDDTRGDGETRKNTTYTKYNANIRLAYQITDNWNTQIKFDNTTAKDVENPGDIKYGDARPGLKDMSRYSAEISVLGNITKNNRLNVQAYYGSEQSSTFTLYEGYSDPQAIEPYKSFEEEYIWQGFQISDVHKIKDHSITLGLDYNDANHESMRYKDDESKRAPYNPDYAMATLGIYTQGQFTFFDDKLNSTIGLRYDNIKYNIFETELIDNKAIKESNNFFSPSLGLQYHFTKKISAHTTIGRGFAPANVYHIAAYSEKETSEGHVSVTQGNPDLENMESLTWDFGIAFDHILPGAKFDIAYFNTKFKNNSIADVKTLTEINLTAQGDTIDAITSYLNADESLIHGLEIMASYDFGALADFKYSLNLFINWDKIISAKEIVDEYSIGEIERNIHNVADNNLRFGLEFNNKKWLRCGLTGRYKGNRYNRNWGYYNEYVEVEYAKYMVMDAYLGITFLKFHDVSVFANNLTDENYYEKRGYNMPGRSIHIRYTFTF